MRLKDSKTITAMIGKKLYLICAEYISGTPKEYVGKIVEYIILGVSEKGNGNNILCWDPDRQIVDERWLNEIRGNLNANNIRTQVWGHVYAYAFTKEAAEKCLKGLQASIDADYKRKQKWAQIKTKSYTFTLDKLDNSGLWNLVREGIEATDVTSWNDHKAATFCLPDGYEKAIDRRGFQDLRALDFIGTGKHIFENSGNDICNPGEKGKLVPERDIKVLVEISEDEEGKKDPSKTFKAGGKCYTHDVKWLKLRVYIKLPYNNYVSIKKFNKFFNMFDLQKVN